MQEQMNSYTALMAELERVGEGKLHKEERAQLVEAADALLFSEPQAQTQQREALQMLDSLVEKDRWLPETAERVRNALAGCAAPQTATV